MSGKKEIFTETATRKFFIHVCNGRSESSLETFITGSCENREEATGMKRDVLSTKRETRIGFSNVRTMLETGRLAQVTAEMRKYKLHILGVSKNRWAGTRKIKTSL